MLLLHDLLRPFHPPIPLGSISNVEILGIREDSRQVRPGDLFIARGGTQTDGAKFIADAKAKGAVAVVSASAIADCPLPQVIVSDPAAAASVLAHGFFGDPSEKLKVVGVTGTNGKTTVAYLLRHVLNHFKQRCGMIGTVEIDDGRTRRESVMTTPGAIEVAELMATMRDKGCRACAMETSSHSLHQGRVAGVQFAGAAFTNLTGDHLDYHKTMVEYAAAKAQLFERLPSDGVAAVNADDPWTLRMIRDCQARIIRYGFGKSADYRARDVAITAAGTHFILHTPDGRAEIDLQLIGKHNIENALAAAALLGEVFGLSVHQLAAGLKDAPGAPGRLQAVRCGQPFAVLVDYAHTDDALENVLSALRPLTRGRLRVLFGCGGDRDRTKRPRMARTAEKRADVIYVTSDNPRTENAQAILDEIRSGFSHATSKEIHVEIDRRRAIERVLNDAEPNDVVLIAGKGHENYQIIGTTKQHFDDVEECRRVLGGSILSAGVLAEVEGPG
jgi:UDP-N-acetylmuramoyl-L-alanyl-D-glutamate--2,6-diaminopimelate ligase